MFKLNLKISFRNLFKNKIYAFINIIGLALGLTAFVFLILYINHEQSYDSWSPELKNVYQIREKHSFMTPDNKQHWQEIEDSRMAILLREKVPQIAATTKVDDNFSFRVGYSIKIDNAEPIVVKNIKDADSCYFNVFPHVFLQGDKETALKANKSIVLKYSIAQKLFGTDKILGKIIKVVRWRQDKGESLTITGIVEDTNSPESAGFNALMRTGEKDNDPTQASNSNYCQVYARVNDNVDTLALNQTLQKVYVDFKKASLAELKIGFEEYYKEGNSPGLKAVPLKEVHSNPPFNVNWLTKLKPVIGISIFLLLISVINFINLATAQSVQRAKEVGVKKVLGAYKKQLVTQFLIESGIQSTISLLLCIILIELLLPAFNQQFNVELSFFSNRNLSGMILQLAGLFAIVTLLAGFYPAWILSNYNPVAVLKGNYENGLKGVVLRNILVVFQFIISVTFIIAVVIMHLQTTYMNSKDLGFDKNRLINIRSGYEDDFAGRLKRITGVKYVGTTTQLMGNVFNVPEKISYKGNRLSINTVSVSMDALQALGVKVLAGRIFSKEYKQDTVNSVVMNEAAAKLLDKNPVGQTYDLVGTDEKEKFNFQIVGVIKNYHNEGFDKEVMPTIYKVTKLGGISMTNNIIVRIDTDDSAEVIKKIEAEWKTLYPDFPMEYTTMEDAFKKVMENNERFTNMILLFSLVSVSLSLLGLFGLSTFVAKRRTKEIAVRKVLGASNLQIVNLLNRSFLFLVIAANLISWPIAYIIIKTWLDGFAYRIEIPLLPFLIATMISIIIAVLTVSIQARRAAVADPVNALKYE